MHWLDHVLAIPTIGLQFSPRHRSSGDYLAALAPMLGEFQNKWGNLTISTSDATSLAVEAESGMSIRLDSQNVVVDYNLKGTLRDVPGGRTILDYNDEPRQFTSLVKLQMSVVSKVSRLVHQPPRGEVSAGTLLRVGVVSAVRLKREALPPGIAALRDAYCRPFGTQALGRIKVTTLVPLELADAYSDRCHYTYDEDIDREDGEDVRFHADFQRVYSEPVQVTMWSDKRWLERISLPILAGVKHFERMGEQIVKGSQQ